ncbi:MAG: hypothetical protein ABJL72_11455 [Roseobacter sp.]
MPSTTTPSSDKTSKSMFAIPEMIVAIGFFAAAIVIAVGASFGGIELARLVRDPAAIYKYPSYIGFFSHIGVALMTSTMAITGFAAIVGRNNASESQLILSAVAALSGLLIIDDVFMLHEAASRLGEVAIYGVYGLLGMLIWLRLRTISDQYDIRGFKVALFFLGLSVFTDIFKIYGPFAHWLEDFSKLSGFAAWLAFWARFAAHSLKP